jgi:hypothetical protein
MVGDAEVDRLERRFQTEVQQRRRAEGESSLE